MNETTKENGEVALVVPKENSVVLQGNPQEQMEYAIKSSKMLTQVLSQKKKPVMMNGEQFLEFEDWQTLGRFYGVTCGTESTKEIIRDGKLFGYESKAVAYSNGQIISSAEAMCCRDEPNWGVRAKFDWVNGRKVKVGDEPVPEFQLRSMAQTRANSKVLRNVLAWVAVLGGFKPTPAEEMDGIIANATPVAPTHSNIPNAQVKKPSAYDGSGIHYTPPKPETTVPDIQMEEEFELPEVPNVIPASDTCVACGNKVTQKVYDYSLQKFGAIYCYDHQPKR